MPWLRSAPPITLRLLQLSWATGYGPSHLGACVPPAGEPHVPGSHRLLLICGVQVSTEAISDLCVNVCPSFILYHCTPLIKSLAPITISNYLIYLFIHICKPISIEVYWSVSPTRIQTP